MWRCSPPRCRASRSATRCTVPSDLYEPEKWHLREKTARATFVACISHFARAQAMHFSDPVHWPKLRIVHCGVVPDLYDRPVPAPHSGTRLIFVGRLAAVKGLRVLIEAFAQARQTRPDLHLTLVGDGDDRAMLERLAAPLGDAVHFAGYLSQEAVAAALAEADAFVLPSFAEGLPVVLMEALAAGRPVIATQVAGVSELVEDGVTGFIVPPGDSETLADRIGRLADDPDLRARMGRAGRETVRAAFDARQEARRIGALFAGQAGPACAPPRWKTRRSRHRRRHEQAHRDGTCARQGCSHEVSQNRAIKTVLAGRRESGPCSFGETRRPVRLQPGSTAAGRTRHERRQP